MVDDDKRGVVLFVVVGDFQVEFFSFARAVGSINKVIGDSFGILFRRGDGCTVRFNEFRIIRLVDGVWND